MNRHEFGLQGRVMTREQTEEDLRALKRINVNAIRTSHYPNNTFFYELADRYGFLVIDEMNLETHGLWDRIRYLGETDCGGGAGRSARVAAGPAGSGRRACSSATRTTRAS